MEILVAMVLFTCANISFYFGTRRYWNPLPIRRWSYRRIFYLATFYILGLGFTVKGVAQFVEMVSVAGNCITALGVFMTVFVPCYDPSWNKFLHLRLLRATALSGIAAVLLYRSF